ncbi:hypothetical protein BH09VER1_BH09VER1_49840 [soil metagenome]
MTFSRGVAIFHQVNANASPYLILGIDGGATKTNWVVCEQEGESLRQIEHGTLGPGNMKLHTPESLRSMLESMPKVAARVGIYLAGCATEQDRAKLSKLAASIWPQAEIHAGSDRDSAFAAAFGHGDGIAVIAGTGSAVTGRKGGQEDRAGGWGHLLGDAGGGYDLAIHALRGILLDFDTNRRIDELAQDVLRVLGLNSLQELTGWAQVAKKDELARLTPLVFKHADSKVVAQVIRYGANNLATLVGAVASRLALEHPRVSLSGGLFLREPLYVKYFTEAMKARCPTAEITISQTPAALGAALLATEASEVKMTPTPPEVAEPGLNEAATEQANPRSIDLDLLPVAELVNLFVREERLVEDALEAVAPELTRAVELVTAAMKKGGRLFYAGAGTSGRLGVLDASEIPPTFGLPPDRVQAIMAGGAVAIQQSVEGAEDDAAAGALAVQARGFTAADVLCGIAASGRTPFVRGALEAARALGAGTILLTANPARKKGLLQAEVEIDLPTGAELITGSTRLKAGTATKVALNILTSCTMIRLGRVHGNFMTHLQPTNEKLRHRAVQIVAARLGVAEEEARNRLTCSNWSIVHALESAPKKS